jgi:hypothetical protein
MENTLITQRVDRDNVELRNILSPLSGNVTRVEVICSGVYARYTCSASEQISGGREFSPYPQG